MVKLLTEDVNTLIIPCGGCDKSIVIQGDNLFTVNKKFVKKLFNKHKSNPCGKILITDLSDTAKSMITDNKISELHQILKDNCDISEFIKNI